jgi:branched-chain amino acid transport system ATP-binding protein
VVGVIGPNGAGKTTLFNVICGFVRPSDGRLEFNGKPLRKHRSHDLARLGIARTLQGIGLFSGMTVLANVTAGATARAGAGLAAGLLVSPRSTREEASLRDSAMQVLTELRIADYANRMPGELPYAIQKQVALARALVNEPALLLLDEPASGLSEGEIAELGSLIRSLRARMGIVLVEHHMDFVMSVCDRIVVLNFGRVIASGTPEVVKADPLVTKAYLGEELSREAHVPGAVSGA